MSNLISDEYMTGNAGMDDKIRKALAKEQIKAIVKLNKDKYPHKTTRLQDIMQIANNDKKPRITVSDKEYRTYKDGTVFASRGEMLRWEYLISMEKAGGIKDLKRQVEFLLLSEFTHEQWGVIRHIKYVADFTYTNIWMRKEYLNRYCVEDSKGRWLTDIYKFKKKLFLSRYPDYLFFEIYE